MKKTFDQERKDRHRIIKGFGDRQISPRGLDPLTAHLSFSELPAPTPISTAGELRELGNVGSAGVGGVRMEFSAFSHPNSARQEWGSPPIDTPHGNRPAGPEGMSTGRYISPAFEGRLVDFL